MKIGIEAQRIFRKKKHGMDFVALELIKNLPLSKTHHYFVFVNATDDEIDASMFPHVTIVNKKSAYPIWEQFWLPKKAAELQLDLLHCTANTFPVRCKVPTVLTLHDIIFLETHPLLAKDYTLYQRFGNLYRRILVNNWVKKMKAVATVSEFEFSNIAKKLPHTKNLQVVYNGVGTHFNTHILSEENKMQLAKKYALPTTYFLFLGNTDPKKNTPNTFKAFAKFLENNPEANLVVGDLAASFIEQCLPGKKYEHARKHILPVGYIANTDLPGLLKMARAFLYPSQRESFGIPLLEGLACGVPVLTSNRSSLPEISGGAAVEIDPNNTEEMATQMHKLWNDDAFCDNLQTKGPARSAAFSWKKMAKTYVAMYEQTAL